MTDPKATLVPTPVEGRETELRPNVQEARFQQLCSHLGGGNPAGGIWVIGIEEGGQWTDAQQIDDFIDGREGQVYDWREPGDPKVQGWRISQIVSKICHGITGLSDSWESFQDEHYLTRRGPLFTANMYPLAKPTAAAMPAAYAEWFGIADAKDYREKTEASGRFDMLRDLWAQSRPRVTLCHGKGHWDNYRKLLRLSGSVESIDNGRIQAYDGGVFLTPHLSWATHMPDSRIEALTRRARPYWQ